MPRRLLLLSTVVFIGFGVTSGTSDQGSEATSLLGRKLFAPAPTPEAKTRMDAQLATAVADWEKNRDDADALIWVGRRTAYLGRYREAIGIYSDGIKRHPNDARFYRHRGHRYLTVR